MINETGLKEGVEIKMWTYPPCNKADTILIPMEPLLQPVTNATLPSKDTPSLDISRKALKYTLESLGFHWVLESGEHIRNVGTPDVDADDVDASSLVSSIEEMDSTYCTASLHPFLKSSRYVTTPLSSNSTMGSKNEQCGTYLGATFKCAVQKSK